MKQSTRAERLGARVLYEWGEMNVAEIARDTGRSQKTIHEWKKVEGWVHPDDQQVEGDLGLSPWPEAPATCEPGPPAHRIGRPQDAGLKSKNPIDVSGSTETARHTSNPALRAELEALQAARDALQAARDALQAELGKYK